MAYLFSANVLYDQYIAKRLATTSAKNVIDSEIDFPSLIIHSTTVGSPSENTFEVTNSDGTTKYFVIDKSGFTSVEKKKLKFLSGNGNEILVKSPTTTAGAYEFTLPPNAGTNNYVLATDGAGVLSWAPATLTGVGTGVYGVFSDSTDQTFSANTATALTLNTTEETNGTYIGSPTSRIYVNQNGVYNIAFSAQLVHTAGGNETISIWLRKNGTDVSRSNTNVVLEGNNGAVVTAWNWMLTLSANDYVEIMFSTTDTDIKLDASATATSPTRPATPSLIVTVNQVINTQQGSGTAGTNRASEYVFFHDHETTQVAPLVTTFSATAGASALQSGAYTSSTSIGQLGLYTGTASTGRAGLASHLDMIQLGANSWTFETKLLLSNLSDATDTFTARLGFLDTQTGESTDFVGFRYTHGTNSGKWECVTRSNSTETAVDSGTSPSAGTYQTFKIEINSTATSVTFYINGSSVGTITSNIPSGSSRLLGFGYLIAKSVGTNSRSMHFDYTYAKSTLGSNR